MSYQFEIVAPSNAELGDEEGSLELSLGAVVDLRNHMGSIGMIAGNYEDADVPLVAAAEAYWDRAHDQPGYDETFADSPEGKDLEQWRPPAIGDVAVGAVQAGIAFHKLFLPGHWWVTAAECSEALAAWRSELERYSTGSNDTHVTEERTGVFRAGLHIVGPLSAGMVDEWFEWLAFLEHAALGDGFMVN